MLTYVRNKLLNNKWMAISLLIGNILLMAIAGSSPIYREAVMQRLLQTKQETRRLLNTGTENAVPLQQELPLR